MRWTEEQYALHLATHGQPASVRESAWQQRVRAYAAQQGWMIYHTRDSRGSDAGFPDLVLVRGKRVVWAELKSPTGKLTREQDRWLSVLRHAEQEVYLWRPADWTIVQEVLA